MLNKKLSMIFLISFILIRFSSAVFLPESYSVSVKYYNGTISIQDVSKIQKNSFVGNVEGDYCVRSISFDREILKKSCFNFPLEKSISYGRECYIESGVLNASKCGGSFFESDLGFKESYIPFSPSSEYIEIVNLSGNVLDRFDVSKLSCGNNICDSHETIESCESDCKAKEVFEKIVKKDVEKVNESIFDEPILKFALGLLVIVILFFVVRAAKPKVLH